MPDLFLHLFIFQYSYSFDTYNYLCTDYPLRLDVCFVVVPSSSSCTLYILWNVNAIYKLERKKEHTSTNERTNETHSTLGDAFSKHKHKPSTRKCAPTFPMDKYSFVCLSVSMNFETDEWERERVERMRMEWNKNTRHLQFEAMFQPNHSQSLFNCCSDSRTHKFHLSHSFTFPKAFEYNRRSHKT